MRHVLFFNTIFLRGFGVASGVRTKEWFQFFKNKQNDIFFNGFANVLNHSNTKTVDLYDSIKNLNGNSNSLLRI